MSRIALFASGGYTEVGGIQQFVERIAPDISCVRLFPVVRKPAPKKGLDRPAPVQEHSGVSGERLVTEMLCALRKAMEKNEIYDAILLVDDGDCRFSDCRCFQNWINETEKRIFEETSCAWPFFVLIASPEIETWLCADWENSFAREYPRDIARRVRVEIARHGILVSGEDLEFFGFPRKNEGGCSVKLSTELQKIFPEICSEAHPFSYSKQVQGQAMLKRIQPENVAEKCRCFFRPVFLEFCESLHNEL